MISYSYVKGICRAAGHLFILLAITTDISSCSPTTLSKANSQAAQSTTVPCGKYSISKTTSVRDSVRLNLEIKSCIHGLTVPGWILIKDRTGRIERFNAFNPVTRIVLKKDAYTIQAIAMGYKGVTVPRRTYKPGDYNISFNLEDAEPMRQLAEP